MSHNFVIYVADGKKGRFQQRDWEHAVMQAFFPDRTMFLQGILEDAVADLKLI